MSRRRASGTERLLVSVIGAGLAAAAMSAPASAETKWRVETTMADGSVETAEIWANADNIRMSMADGGEEGEVMLLGASDELIVIDHAEKSYFVIKIADMAATAAAVREQIEAADIDMGAVQAQMKAAMADAMANLSPEDRAAAAAAIGNLPAMAGSGAQGLAAVPVYDVKRTDGAVNVMGASAATYAITEDGAPGGEIWAVKTSEVEGGAVMRDRMSYLFSQMERAMAGFSPKGASRPFQMLDKIDGRVPVGGVEPDGPGGEMTTRLVAAADIAAPDGLWAPPKGYRKEESPF